MSELPIFDHQQTLQIEGILPNSTDRYNGIIIDSKGLPIEINEFTLSLARSLEYWKRIGKRGIWLKIPIELVDLIAPAVKNGFAFHHAEKGYLMLNTWLSEEENKLPCATFHHVGVGCVVIHNNKLLLVQEKNGPLKGTGIWKLPTGLADLGEDVADAAKREVLEETGVETEFESILCIRHSHFGLFEKSDLFFVCVLKPVCRDTVIPTIVQESEIAACEWIEPETYFNQPFYSKSPLLEMINSMIRKVLDVHGNKCDLLNNPADGKDIVNNDISSNLSESEVTVEQSTVLPSMIISKLPVGFRPGDGTLYHFPI